MVADTTLAELQLWKAGGGDTFIFIVVGGGGTTFLLGENGNCVMIEVIKNGGDILVRCGTKRFFKDIKRTQDSSRKCSAWKDFRFKFLSFKFPPEG